MFNKRELLLLHHHMLSTLRLLLVGHAFGSEFPSRQWAAAIMPGLVWLNGKQQSQ